MITFNISKMHTIFENTDESKINDETGANIDNTLGDNDLLKIYDDICPISGDIFASMKNAAADPKNLKVTVVKDGDGEKAKLFVEAVEFYTFIEAADLDNEGEASKAIIDTYKTEIPELDNSEFHVVFPHDALNKNHLGCETDGRACLASWPMRMMAGCRRYGLKVNAGISVEPVESESKKK